MTATATLNLSRATTPWQIDPSHSDVQFAVRHLMISTVKGRFAEVSGTVAFDPENPIDIQVDVTIPVASLQSHNEQRDAHLKSPDFFDAENHPTLTFRGRRIEGDVSERFKLIGDLTIRGITKEVALQVSTEGAGEDPWGNERMGFHATTQINRFDFGLQWNAALETGGVVVGSDVKITIDVEVMRPKS
jgi:polyisoprenoid-binding protein YceI